MTAQAKPSFDVVFVCTGNRFRSPLAAALMEKWTAGLPVAVTSMGTLDLGSVGPLEEAVELGSAYDVSLTGHRTQPIRRGSLTEADLVVGFERVHIVAAVNDGGTTPERAFTLPDLVELLERGDGRPSSSEPVERARHALVSAHQARVGTKRERMPEVPDPLGQPRQMQEHVAERLSDLTRRLALHLFGPESQG